MPFQFFQLWNAVVMPVGVLSAEKVPIKPKRKSSHVFTRRVTLWQQGTISIFSGNTEAVVQVLSGLTLGIPRVGD
jgi:hypothetical protein